MRIKGNWEIGVIGVLIVSLFLASCDTGTTLSQWPSKTPSNTPIVCPTSISHVSENIQVSPSLYIVLFETNTQYFSYTMQAVQLFMEMIPHFINPGDRFIFLRIEEPSLDYAILQMKGLESLSPPSYRSTSTPVPPYSPIATPDTDQCLAAGHGGIYCVNQRDTVKEKNAELAVTATIAAQLNDCVVKEEVQTNSELSQNWELTKVPAVGTFIADLTSTSDISSNADLPDDKVLEGLINASKIIEYECGKYSNCVLITFSDLHDWRATLKDQYLSNYTNVDVIGVMLNCQYINQPSCMGWQEHWRPRFINAGATSVEFIDGENVLTKLVELIRRTK